VPTTIDVRDAAGRRVAADLVRRHDDGGLDLRWPDGRLEHVRPDQIVRSDAATAELRLAFTELPGGDPSSETHVVPIVAEELDVETIERETGRVRVRTSVEERDEEVAEDVAHDVVEVRRVPIDRYVDEPVGVREEEGVLIVPVHEEVLVVEKRLLLKEEVHLSTRRETRRETQTVRLRLERADIERIDPDEA
jgi:stress response protein YsnF